MIGNAAFGASAAPGSICSSDIGTCGSGNDIHPAAGASSSASGTGSRFGVIGVGGVGGIGSRESGDSGSGSRSFAGLDYGSSRCGSSLGAAGVGIGSGSSSVSAAAVKGGIIGAVDASDRDNTCGDDLSVTCSVPLAHSGNGESRRIAATAVKVSGEQAQAAPARRG